jgi:hypothetical protein
MLGRNIGHFLSCKPNKIRQSKNKLKINLKKFAQSKYGCIFVPAIKLNIKTNIMKTFLSKQKYQVYAIGFIAIYFLTRFFY